MSVLKNIKAVRRKRGVNQHDMAEKLCITASTYQKMEQGLISLSIDRFIEICRILEVRSYNDLLPVIHAEIVQEIVQETQNVLMSGSLAFDIICNNSNYSRKLLMEIIEKIETDNIEKKIQIEELRFLDNYLAIIGKESLTNRYKIITILNRLKEID